MRKQSLAYALAITLTGLITGCATWRKCGLQGCGGDAQITTSVQSLFDEHPEIGARVNVQTQNRVVYLSGYVDAGEMRTVAVDVAGTAPGVAKVVDSISVTH